MLFPSLHQPNPQSMSPPLPPFANFISPRTPLDVTGSLATNLPSPRVYPSHTQIHGKPDFPVPCHHPILPTRPQTHSHPCFTLTYQTFSRLSGLDASITYNI